MSSTTKWLIGSIVCFGLFVMFSPDWGTIRMGSWAWSAGLCFANAFPIRRV